MQSPSDFPEGICCIFIKKNFKNTIKIANWVLKPSAKYSIIETVHDGYLPFCEKEGNETFLKESRC